MDLELACSCTSMSISRGKSISGVSANGRRVTMSKQFPILLQLSEGGAAAMKWQFSVNSDIRGRCQMILIEENYVPPAPPGPGAAESRSPCAMRQATTWLWFRRITTAPIEEERGSHEDLQGLGRAPLNDSCRSAVSGWSWAMIWEKVNEKDEEILSGEKWRETQMRRET